MALPQSDTFAWPRKSSGYAGPIVNEPKRAECHLCPRDFILTISLIRHLESAHKVNFE